MASRADAIPTGGTADYSNLEGNYGFQCWHHDRVVRLLHFSAAWQRSSRSNFIPRKRYVCLRRLPGDICRGFPSASLRSALFGRIGDLVGRKYAFSRNANHLWEELPF